ncbi:MAG: PIG-L family deacetylase [Opitutaceae bacterium]|nr:PIG-L family deacetylase [Opitutaceae bacterium]
MSGLCAIAIAAHPDDIEFTMAGTLCLLREAGIATHYLNVSTGSCGSLQWPAAKLRGIRRREGQAAAKILGATFHASRTDDLEILYTTPLLRWLTGVIREVRPTIVLTHPPQDYMEDHMNTCRLAITATFARGCPNFKTTPAGRPAWSGDATVYHAMPVGLQDSLRRRVAAGSYVDTTTVQKTKLAALACHESQHGWLQATQGLNSYLRTMEDTSRELGRLSRRFRHAEGWRRHSHMGFCAEGADPLRDALGKKYLVNAAYERDLARG